MEPADNLHYFDFDLDRGIRSQVVEKLEASPLLRLTRGAGPALSGIYALYFKSKLVYIGKASKGTTKSKRTLRSRLRRGSAVPAAWRWMPRASCMLPTRDYCTRYSGFCRRGNSKGIPKSAPRGRVFAFKPSLTNSDLVIPNSFTNGLRGRTGPMKDALLRAHGGTFVICRRLCWSRTKRCSPSAGRLPPARASRRA